jgi:para-aminobenzoate synthetase/4-amino-4-deoxychorismate lyase
VIIANSHYKIMNLGYFFRISLFIGAMQAAVDNSLIGGIRPCRTRGVAAIGGCLNSQGAEGYRRIMLGSELNGLVQPFVLLDDARVEGASPARLFRNPISVHRADTAPEVPALLDVVEQAGRDGYYVAGYLHYEAGMGLPSAWRGDVEQVAAPSADEPLGWFGIFKDCTLIAPDAVADWLPDPASAWVGSPRPRVMRADYLRSVERLLAYIEAGDIYQANFTFPADVPFVGNALSVYARLRQTAKAGYGGVIWTGEQAIASLSPELFFSLRGGQVMARPMKGTAARVGDAAADAAAAVELAQDEKQRAENLMIVDLIRNDLSRVAEAGSVKVPNLFRVETFPTIHQLVSDVTAQLPEALGAVDVLRAAFPCGSITGAPKVRAMEIIHECEGGKRGFYTGSIGFIDPSGDAAFNVAIRTLVFPNSQMAKDGAACASMGLGSGIVADSQPDTEWRECLAKGNFVTAAGENFDLLETLAFEPVEGLQRLERHLSRLAASADAFGFHFNRHDVRNRLQAATFRVNKPSRVRMRLGRSGALAVEISPMPAQAQGDVQVGICAAPLSAGDYRIRYKTSLRTAYDQARVEAGTPEVVFVDEDGFVTEGSYTTIFVARDGMLLTPPLSRAVLPGILREELINQGQAIESPLRIEDLKNGFLIGNSLRGLMPASLAKVAA